MEYNDFSPLHLDAIREVVNIGAGNAATALSEMLGKPVDMGVPDVELVSIYEVSEHFGPPEDFVAAVYTHGEGTFPCNLIFIQDEEAAQGMVDAMFISRMNTDGRDFPPGDERQRPQRARKHNPEFLSERGQPDDRI